VANVGRATPYHTASGVHAVQAFIANAMGDLPSVQAAVDAFVLASQAPCDGWDVTLGRSGTLLMTSLLVEAIVEHELVNLNGLIALGDATARSVREKVESLAPIREDAEIRYTGAAHGWAGILYAMLCWCRASGQAVPSFVGERLEQLAQCAQPFGRGLRWRWHTRERGQGGLTDYMPGWCNGTAGFVHLWTLAHESFGTERYLSLAEQTAWDVWDTASAFDNLCCGMAGQAYALLDLYTHTGQSAWLRRARELTARAAIAGKGRHDELALRSESLYKGDLGVAVLAVELSKPEWASMPLYAREGWRVRARP
jgi:serine/threonine-protein kinase